MLWEHPAWKCMIYSGIERVGSGTSQVVDLEVAPPYKTDAGFLLWHCQFIAGPVSASGFLGGASSDGMGFAV